MIGRPEQKQAHEIGGDSIQRRERCRHTCRYQQWYDQCSDRVLPDVVLRTVEAIAGCCKVRPTREPHKYCSDTEDSRVRLWMQAQTEIGDNRNAADQQKVRWRIDEIERQGGLGRSGICSFGSHEAGRCCRGHRDRRISTTTWTTRPSASATRGCGFAARTSFCCCPFASPAGAAWNPGRFSD